MKQLVRITGFAALAALVLVGCGDDGGTSSAPSNADQIVASFEDLAVCTAKREGASAYVRDEKTEYVCVGGDWIPASGALSSRGGSSASSGGDPDGSYNTYGWSAEVDGNLKKGQITEAFYKYDSLQAQWVEANARDTALGLNGCTQKREAEVGIGDDYGYYICRNGQWQNTSGLEYVRSAKTCAHTAELVVGSTADANRYVCDADIFRVASESERSMNRGCTSYNLNKENLLAGYMVCKTPGKWDATTHTVAGTMTYGGQTYKTIGIGTQMWMAENLNYEYKVNGSTYGNWCYKDSAQYCAKYGRLYTWGAAMDSATTGCGYGKECVADTGRVKGVCPTGWHLPSLAEWDTLFTAVGGEDGAGTKLKSTSGWSDLSGRNNGNGTDAYGFSALPSGLSGNHGFYYAGLNAYFWSSSEGTQNYAYNRDLYYYNANANPDSSLKFYSFAVRCLRD